MPTSFAHARACLTWVTHTRSAGARAQARPMKDSGRPGPGRARHPAATDVGPFSVRAHHGLMGGGHAFHLPPSCRKTVRSR
eukprot:753501-Hanusia_phi.AAC.3